MNQIKVELLDNKNDDLFVVNAARVSFNKWHDTFKPKGTGYLVGWMIFACVLLLAIFGIANYKKKDA